MDIGLSVCVSEFEKMLIDVVMASN